MSRILALIMSVVVLCFNVTGSSEIGGIKETQEMLDYSIRNNIYPQVKIIKGTPDEVAKQITEAYNTVVDGKVQFRFVIDMRNW